MKLVWHPWARFIGSSADSVQLPSRDIRELQLPDDAIGVEVFDHVTIRTEAPGIEGLISSVSEECNVQRYVFGTRVAVLGEASAYGGGFFKSEFGEGTQYVLTSRGWYPLQPGDVFVQFNEEECQRPAVLKTLCPDKS